MATEINTTETEQEETTKEVKATDFPLLERLDNFCDEHFEGYPTLTPVKAYLKAVATHLDEAFENGISTVRILNARSQAIDNLLTYIWWDCFQDQAEDYSLIAVGGYGRAELHPYSDIDLLILTPKESKLPPEFTEQITKFITWLWDTGLDVGHSVRSVKECMKYARDDVTIMTNLLESRQILGNKELYSELETTFEKNKVWPSDKFFKAKYEEQQARHHKFQKTSYALEPNIKKSPGALREIQLIGWIAKRHFNVNNLKSLVGINFLTGHEYTSLEYCQDFLWTLRFALHQIAGRGEDRLLFDHQRPIADKLGYKDSEHRAGVEHLMQDYYTVVKTVRELNDMILQHMSEEIFSKGNEFKVTPINGDFQRYGNRIEAKRADLFLTDHTKLIECFLHIANDPEIEGIRANTLRNIFLDRQRINFSEFQNDPKCHELFLEILRHPNGMRAFTYMKRYGVLRVYLPVYAKIVGQMQFDLFHIYTVDEHTLFLMNNIADFALPEQEAEFPLCHEVISQVKRRELLLLGALFHDIGKGRGGDHSEIGAEEARTFCAQIGLSEEDAELVIWLVADHLVMSMTAQRKDINDPDVINQFASRVKTIERLNNLYLLTVADICATSQSLWNNWKGSLLAELYRHTRNALERGLENPRQTDDAIADNQATAKRILIDRDYDEEKIDALWGNFKPDYFVRNPLKRIIWQTRKLLKRATSQTVVSIYQSKQSRTTEVFVYMSKHEHYFTQITSLIYKKNMSIHDASLHSTTDGFMLGSFVILEADGTAISDHRRALSIKYLLGKKLSQPGKLDYEGSQKPHYRYQHFSVPTEVTFSPSENGNRTLVELSALDRPGLLAVIGMAFLECNVELHSAKVVTLGEKVEDVFSVTNRDESLLSKEQQEALKVAIIKHIDQPED